MGIEITIEDKTATGVLLAMGILLGVIAIALFLSDEKKQMCLITVSVFFVLAVVVLAAMRLCYVLAAKSIAQSAIQLKIEEEKRKGAEIKRDIEYKKYECAGKVHKVQIV